MCSFSCWRRPQQLNNYKFNFPEWKASNECESHDRIKSPTTKTHQLVFHLESSYTWLVFFLTIFIVVSSTPANIECRTIDIPNDWITIQTTSAVFVPTLPPDGASTWCSWRDCSAGSWSSGGDSLWPVLAGTICWDKRWAKCNSTGSAWESPIAGEVSARLTASRSTCCGLSAETRSE